MSTFLEVFKMILAVIGCLLVILLLFSVRLEVLWQEGILSADVRYLFFNQRLIPKSRKEHEEKDGDQKEEDASDGDDGTSGSGTHTEDVSGDHSGESNGKENKKKESTSLYDTVEKIVRIVSPLLKPGFWLVRMLLRCVHVSDVTVNVSVTGTDPASIGFRSGIHWSLIGNLMQMLNLLFGKNVTYSDITVYPCFGDAEPIKEKMGCTVTVRPLIIILLVLGFGLGYLFEVIRNLLNRGGKKNVN